MKYPDLKRNKKVVKPQQKKSAKKSWRYVFLFIFLLFLGAVSVYFFSDKVRALFDPVSVVSNFNPSDIKETDGRTNILLLGSDRRADDPVENPDRADTILVVSASRLDKNVVLISVPRDLWVESPVCGRCKITEVYAYAAMQDVSSPEASMEEAVSQVLGIPIHYHAVVNFELFEGVIDTLGGITIDVENAFDDYMYPIEGKEDDLCGRTQEEINELLCLDTLKDDVEELSSEEYKEDDEDKEEAAVKRVCRSPLEVVPCRFEHVRFEAGVQEMDGKRALKYARSRYGNNSEGTDFARAARQQKVIMAVKNKATSLETLLNFRKVKELYDLYKDTVITNVDFTTIQEMYLLSQKLEFEEIRTVVLDDRSTAGEGGLLYSPLDLTLYDGKYVLLPRSGNYGQIHAYVQKFLFEK